MLALNRKLEQLNERFTDAPSHPMLVRGESGKFPGMELLRAC
jgi:hypothetical protein